MSKDVSIPEWQQPLSWSAKPSKIIIEGPAWHSLLCFLPFSPSLPLSPFLPSSLSSLAFTAQKGEQPLLLGDKLCPCRFSDLSVTVYESGETDRAAKGWWSGSRGRWVILSHSVNSVQPIPEPRRQFKNSMWICMFAGPVPRQVSTEMRSAGIKQILLFSLHHMKKPQLRDT